MSIDHSTGLPEGMSNRTSLLDRIKSVAEGAEMTLQASIPLKAIEDILLETQLYNYGELGHSDHGQIKMD